MDPVDEFTRLKAEVRRLQDRAEVLREGVLRPRARLWSNRFDTCHEIATFRAGDPDIVLIE